MIDKNLLVAGAPALLPLLQADEGPGIPWWVWILIIAVLLFLLFIGLVRQQEPAPPLPKEEKPPQKAEAPVAAEEKEVETKAPPEPSEEKVSEPEEPKPKPVKPAEEEAPAPVEEKPKPIKTAEPDDLKRIEGIGPKISGVLQDAGISTFAQLSETPAERLRQLLDDANIRIADPTTWPNQAKLAAAEKWDELEELQDDLKGGRRD